jgi:hypothetical protein
VIRESHDRAEPQDLLDRILDLLARELVDDPEDRGQRPADRVRAVPSRQLLRRRVDHGHASRRIGDDHAVTDARKRRRQEVVRIPQPGLRLSSLVDVDDEPSPNPVHRLDGGDVR